MATKQAVDIPGLIAKHETKAGELGRDMTRLAGYREGSPAIEQLGIAIPPNLRRFLTVVNWPGTYVESIVERLAPQGFILPDQEAVDDDLWEGWVANDLESESPKLHDDVLTYGRGFVAIGSNELDEEHPLITVESPAEMSVLVDPRSRTVTSACRLYSDEDTGTDFATLYLPTETHWLTKQAGDWVPSTDLEGAAIAPDVHNLGIVPVVPFFNRSTTKDRQGITEMRDVIPLTDAAARALTNLQVGQETHAVPQRWAAGMSKGDFVDKDGNVLPAWQAYFGAVWGTENDQAKFGQFSASDLRNFHDTVKHYALLVSGVTGMNAQTLGFQTDNPASAEGIRASESRLVRKVELRQVSFGDGWGRVMAIYQLFKSGAAKDQPINRVRTEWVDASTPTKESRSASAVALFTANGISREGLWDELGWTEERKDRERKYFEEQEADPAFARLANSLDGALNGNPDNGSGSNQGVPPANVAGERSGSGGGT